MSSTIRKKGILIYYLTMYPVRFEGRPEGDEDKCRRTRRTQRALNLDANVWPANWGTSSGLNIRGPEVSGLVKEFP
ncbi:unnamed protein product [Arctia plantaginis]|uniref:Uncharacterized protein n=1 Tax=Arctia plantaginis TaxID=874455 RepID=A0A8S1ALD1_ARCPL|nr:unnamed protein product [Arctia plantaginis]